jgi:hypothetical protein
LSPRLAAATSAFAVAASRSAWVIGAVDTDKGIDA